MKNRKQAIILCSADAFANGVKPKKIENYLSKMDYNVIRYDTTALSRLGSGKYKRLVPAFHFKKFSLYILEALRVTAPATKGFCERYIVSWVMPRIITMRGALLQRELSGKEPYDLLICEDNFDEGIMLEARVAKIQILDLPAPFAEELFFGSLITKSAYEKLKNLEKEIYAASDHISFHWHTYTDYVRENKYNGDNFLDITYGTDQKKKTAQYAKEPRIIFLGYLGGYWVNLPLLSKLSKLCPNIDVYGGPPPPPHLEINYKGYAPDMDILASYQFGIITISEDELRKRSFSSKHLEYISYGLPVLSPVWRHDSVLDDSSIYFTSNNFLSQLKRYSKRQEWQRKHDNSLRLAKQLSWENALKPLSLLDRKKT